MPLFTDAVENAAIDAMLALAPYASLHSSYSSTGANELAGGSYTRLAVAWDAASGGLGSLNGTEQFDVAANSDVAWIGFWSAVSSGTFRAMFPLGGFAPHPFTSTTTDVLTAPGHSLSDGQTVVLLAAAGSLPSGGTEGTLYFVRDTSGDTFKLAATSGGSAIDLTTTGSGHVQRIISEHYTAAGKYDLSDVNTSLPS